MIQLKTTVVDPILIIHSIKMQNEVFGRVLKQLNIELFQIRALERWNISENTKEQ